MGSIDIMRPRPPSKPKRVKSILKGLACLSVINKHNGLTVAQVSKHLGLPKSTAYRVLETLCHGGYIVRDLDDRYRATSLVRTLSAGFDEEEWVHTIAHPEITALGSKVVWGVAIATPDGLTMRLRDTTDRTSPLAIERWSAGHTLSIDLSSAGHVYLAALAPLPRARLIDNLMQQPLKPDSPLHRRATFETYLDTVRAMGYAVRQIDAKESSVSVPLMAGNRFLAALGIHYLRRAVSEDRLTSDLIPSLQAVAERIGSHFTTGSHAPLVDAPVPGGASVLLRPAIKTGHAAT